MGLAHRLGYRALRPLLFSLDAERAHDWVMSTLERAGGGVLASAIALERIDNPIEIAGIVFPNRVGLAAGLDKEARCLPALASMGFGFIEVGSVAPRGEVWSEPPRIHRFPQEQALINRIGLHRAGVEALCEALARHSWPLDPRASVPVRLGINLACNGSTPAADALHDYATGLRATVRWADYFTINISNPNASNRHVPLARPELDDWLAAVDQIRIELGGETGRTPPVFLKISPDLEASTWSSLCDALCAQRDKISGNPLRWGLIVSNTSVGREAVQGLPHAELRGGLSGAPLRGRVNQLVSEMRAHLGKEFPIIGVGGIMSGADARERIEAGADLVQLYTGLIYRGPDLVREVATALRPSP
jgi:dihydroorotate dehydrogenase